MYQHKNNTKHSNTVYYRNVTIAHKFAHNCKPSVTSVSASSVYLGHDVCSFDGVTSNSTFRGFRFGWMHFLGVILNEWTPGERYICAGLVPRQDNRHTKYQ